jgi:S1-C subfamily serine protease
VRPPLVVLLCLLAAVVGAAGVLFAGEQGGWLHGGTQTVLVRQPLDRMSVPSTIVVSKPVLAPGFQPRRIFAERSPGVVTVFSYFGSKSASSTLDEGSGFVVTKSGLVLTAAHVITSTTGTPGLATPASAVYVQFGDGDRVKARVVGWDLYDDVGVLRLSPSTHRLVPVPLGSSAAVAVGDPVAAIGSPFGNQASLSVGVVSARRTIPSLTTEYDLFDAIQTDVPINQGNSGGPLLNAGGRAIGINAQIGSSSGLGFEGVSFAVPIDAARRSLAQLLASGQVVYAYAGLKTEDLTPGIAKRFGYRASHGALVDVVTAGGPAARAGLRPGMRDVLYAGQEITIGGDAITAIDGAPVASSDDVAQLVAERFVPGEVVWFTIERGGRHLVVAVELGGRPR